MVLLGGQRHRKRDAFKHVRERDVDNEVERFSNLVEDIGHWHGEDVGSGFDGSHHALCLGY